jgi:hypothetical protein
MLNKSLSSGTQRKFRLAISIGLTFRVTCFGLAANSMVRRRFCKRSSERGKHGHARKRNI